MASTRLQLASVVVCFATAAVGLYLATVSSESFVFLAVWTAVLAGAQAMSVPAPSGARIHLGFGVATSAVLTMDDLVSVAATVLLGMALSWMVSVAARSSRYDYSVFVSDTVSVGVFVATFFFTTRFFATRFAVDFLATRLALGLFVTLRLATFFLVAFVRAAFFAAIPSVPREDEQKTSRSSIIRGGYTYSENASLPQM